VSKCVKFVNTKVSQLVGSPHTHTHTHTQFSVILASCTKNKYIKEKLTLK